MCSGFQRFDRSTSQARPQRTGKRAAPGTLPRPEPGGAAAAALRGRLLARDAAQQEGLLGARARAPARPPAARVRPLPHLSREGLPDVGRRRGRTPAGRPPAPGPVAPHSPPAPASDARHNNSRAKELKHSASRDKEADHAALSNRRARGCRQVYGGCTRLACFSTILELM